MGSQLQQVILGGGRPSFSRGNSGLGLLGQRQLSSQRSCTNCYDDEYGSHLCLCEILPLYGYAPAMELCDCETCAIRDEQFNLLASGGGYANLLGVGQQGLLNNGILGGRARGGMGTLGSMNGLGGSGALGGLGALGGRGMTGGLGGGMGSMFGNGLGRGLLGGPRNGALGGLNGVSGFSSPSGIGGYGGMSGIGGGGYGRGGRGRSGGNTFNDLLLRSR